MVTKIDGWKSTDGRLFNSKTEAEYYEACLTIHSALDKHGICRGGEWTVVMVAVSLIDNAADFADALTAIRDAKSPKGGIAIMNKIAS